jgi:C4-dicarboxylate-specific signal transduction histidine kinase
VSIITRGDIAAIEVADFGRGVAPEVAETLFSPFSKSSHRGMGLGLAICQRIATTLGGSLSWRNQEAGGAVFTFTIPLATEGAYP